MSLRKFFKKWLFLNFGLLALESLWRLAFFFLFVPRQELPNLSSDLSKAFVLGLRFDLTVLCYINALPLLVLLVFAVVLKNWPAWLLKITKLWYFSFLVIMTFFNLIDLGFYAFYQDRLNVLVFGFFEDDTIALIKTMWNDYPVIWMLILLFTLAFAIKKALDITIPTKTTLHLHSSRWVLFISLWSLFLLNGLGARGSLTLFPLSEMDTGISKSPFVNQLAFNSSRAFARAVELRLKTNSEWNSNLKAFDYQGNPRQAFADYFNKPVNEVPQDPTQLLQQVTPENKWAQNTRPHVVFVLMESWGAYWMQYQNPEFDLVGKLKPFLKSAFYSPNVISQTGATIGTLSALMAGLPHRYIGEFLSESSYLQAHFRTSPARIYKKAGYETRFVYGGNPGWREVNKFARFQGYDQVDGEHEIAKSLNITQLQKHDWGIHDEDLWKFVEKTLTESQTPQFMVVMTTSNHPPFQLPSDYHAPKLEVPPELEVRFIGDKSIPPKRLRTYRYALDTFADFLTNVKNHQVGQKTIVAATGDHAFWMINFNEKEQLQKNAVPAFLMVPEELKRSITQPFPEFLTQLDLLRTLYDLSLSKQEVWALGENVFRKDYIPHTHGSLPLVVGPTGAVNIGAKSFYNWSQDGLSLVDGQSSSEKEMMATKYKALMSLLDIYMKTEKEHENSRR